MAMTLIYNAIRVVSSLRIHLLNCKRTMYVNSVVEQSATPSIHLSFMSTKVSVHEKTRSIYLKLLVKVVSYWHT